MKRFNVSFQIELVEDTSASDVASWVADAINTDIIIVPGEQIIDVVLVEEVV